VTAARFHNLVLALMLNKVLALSSHQKLDSLMAGLQLPGYCVPLCNLGVDIRDVPLFVEHCEARSLPKLILSGVGLASKDTAGRVVCLACFQRST
jgi:hypothetical protein